MHGPLSVTFSSAPDYPDDTTAAGYNRKPGRWLGVPGYTVDPYTGEVRR